MLAAMSANGPGFAYPCDGGSSRSRFRTEVHSMSEAGATARRRDGWIKCPVFLRRTPASISPEMGLAAVVDPSGSQVRKLEALGPLTQGAAMAGTSVTSAPPRSARHSSPSRTSPEGDGAPRRAPGSPGHATARGIA